MTLYGFLISEMLLEEVSGEVKIVIQSQNLNYNQKSSIMMERNEMMNKWALCAFYVSLMVIKFNSIYQ